MEILNNLTKITDNPYRRIGRGGGSSSGRTAGRGQKGDKARGKTKLTFDGTKIKKGWIKRLPFLRGKNRLQKQYFSLIFRLDQIAAWYKENEVVDMKSLAKKSKLSARAFRAKIKILSAPEFTKALTFQGLQISDKARKQIVAASGKIEE